MKAILKRVLTMFDGEDARYDIDALKQHLDAMPDEVGFVSIFNGKDLTGLERFGRESGSPALKMKPAQLAKAQEKADENMRRDWKVENGLLVFDGTGYDNLCTEKQYGDFEDVCGLDVGSGKALRLMSVFICVVLLKSRSGILLG